MKNKKTITYADIYKKYPYKYWDVTKSTVPMNPYIPMEEISNHEWKMTKSEWMSYINIYTKEVLDHLIQSNSFIIPHGLGELQLRKIPIGDQPVYRWTEVFAKTLPSQKLGYNLRLKWYRKKAMFRLKNLYYFRLPDKVFTKIYSNLIKDTLTIYTYLND